MLQMQWSFKSLLLSIPEFSWDLAIEYMEKHLTDASPVMTVSNSGESCVWGDLGTAVHIQLKNGIVEPL